MNSIEDILAKARIRYQHAPHNRVRTGWIGVDCPKCSPNSNKFRLGFELSTGRAHCWVCGGQYGPNMLAMLLNVSKREAHELLGRPDKYRQETERPTGVLKIPDGVGPLQPGHRAYLQSRRLDPDQVAGIWGVRGIGIALRLQHRLWIPIHDLASRVVSWTTRATHPDAEPRYWAATTDEEEIPHKSLLYGGHLARHAICVVEGSVDCWTMGPGTVGTLGVGFTKLQKCLMARYPIRYILFDAEDDAQQRARELCRELSVMPGHTENILLETGKDPNSADPAEVDTLRRDLFPEYFSEIPKI